MRQRRKSYRDYEDDEDEIGDDLAAVNERLDNLTRQLERVAQTQVGAGKRSASRDDGDDRSTERVSEALSRLDRRLDQIITEGRTASAEVERRARYAPPPAPPPPPPPPPSGPANWAAEISARQRTLDGGGAPARHAAPAPAPSPDLSNLEHHLRAITTQIASLHQPYENALTALRSDLAEVGRALTEAMPKRAVEALESEVRSLAERLDQSRQSGADTGTLGHLEQGLAEIRDSLRTLTPAESLVGFEEAVRGLSRKIDQIAASSHNSHDPAAFHQLEQAIGSLRGIVSNVASDDALAQLAAEVHGLAARFERVASDSSSDALAKLETRIASLMESGRGVPPELEGTIRTLSERLDRMQLSPGDQLAVGSLEDRIAKLAEKLDASDSRLNSLGAVERGIADLLVVLTEMKSGDARPSRAAAPVATIEPPRPEPAPAPAPQPVMVPPPPPPPPAPAAEVIPPAPQPAHRAPPPPQRPRVTTPIDPNLPPDTPLEPGSGVPRSKPGSPAARIAASKAALGSADPSIAEIGSMTAAVAAARGAARTAAAEAPDEPKAKSKWFKKSAKKEKKPKAEKLPPPPKAPELPVQDLSDEAPVPLARRLLKLTKSLLIAGSVVAIAIGGLQTVMGFMSSGPTAETPTVGKPATAPTPPTPVTPFKPGRPMPAPDGTLPEPEAAPSQSPADGGTDASPTNAGNLGKQSSIFDPSTVLKLPADITGSISRKPSSRTAPPAAPANPAAAALPASFGPVLRTAAAANDPAADYEIAVRYAEGRGVPPSLDEAARWFERAAKAGFAPAEFRLAALYERGEGVKKDLNAARRYYLAAADQGHSKSMHNLAVLNAEGIDGKPDYKIAAQWFRKASAYGIADSQYNLAILYARGIGVDLNLAESYKWFALAAAKGDQDAARKRDDVGARLDERTLAAAKLAVQTFIPERESEEAIGLKVPPGGWDKAASPAKPRHRVTTTATE